MRQGFAFCEYANPETTNVAFEGLNGMDIGGQSIKLTRACLGQEQANSEMGVNAMSMLAGTISTTMEKTRVLQLLNMITPEELIRDDDYEGMFTAPGCFRVWRLTSSQISAMTCRRRRPSLTRSLTSRSHAQPALALRPE